MLDWITALGVAGLIIGTICAVVAMLERAKLSARDQVQATADVINETHEQRQPVKVVRIEHPETMQRQAKGFDVTDFLN